METRDYLTRASFDPEDFVTDPKARVMLEELGGKPRELKVKVTGNIDNLKRMQPLLDRAAALDDPPKSKPIG